MKDEKQSRFNRLAKETTRSDAASPTPCADPAAESRKSQVASQNTTEPERNA